MNRTTLTTRHGIKWDTFRVDGKSRFTHNECAVVFEPKDDSYHLFVGNTDCLAFTSIGECLECASEIILDAYAAIIRPSWA